MRYFNKSFFRFALGFLFIVAVSLAVIVAASAYADGISQISFTTDSQIIAPGVTSEAITIQAQDPGGTSVQTPETIDLNLESNSSTGEFLTSSGKPDSKITMNKNTANRTFYYRDSSTGSFDINVTATGRDSKTVWTASQNITVSNNASPSPTSKSVSPTPAPKPKPVPPPTPPPPSPPPAPTPAPAATTTPPPPSPIVSPPIPTSVPAKKTSIKASTEAAAPVLEGEEIKASTSDNIIYEAPRKTGWWSKFWNFLKSLF